MSVVKALDGAAAQEVSDVFRAGLETVDFGGFEKPFPGGRHMSADSIRLVLEEAMRRFPRDKRPSSDAWLGPRLHAVARLTRREAAHQGVWRFLSLVLAPDYVLWRFGDMKPASEGTVAAAAPRDRYLGREDKHALSRLWWAAELFRNGSDYGPAERALGNQDVTNNFMRMKIAHHAPTVQAFMQVLGDKVGREANALAKAANVGATTVVFESLGIGGERDDDALLAWVDEATLYGLADFDSLPLGPDDGSVSPQAAAAIAGLLEELFRTAPVRGRRRPMEKSQIP